MKLTSGAVVSFLASAAALSCADAFSLAPNGAFAARRTRPFALKSTTDRNTDEELFTALRQQRGWGVPAAAPAARVTRAALLERSREYLRRHQGESGAAIVYSKLQEHGVEVVNGYSGGAVLPLLDQFHEQNPRHLRDGAPAPIRWITNSNEASAGHIAEGFAKSMPMHPDRMPVAVVVATSGPGVTNLITPLQDAYCDGVPLVVLCGQAATTAPQDAFQSAPAVAMTTPCCKWSYQIKNAAELPFVMDYAFYMARNGRPGPVFVDLPKDLQNQILDADMLSQYLADDLGSGHPNAVIKIEDSNEAGAALRLGAAATDSEGLLFDLDPHTLQLRLAAHDSDLHADHGPTNTIYHNTVSTEGELENIVREGQLSSQDANSRVMGSLIDMIQRAKKPIILAGQGASDSRDELREFAETLQVPVTTTLHALGVFDERHPLALNMVGMHGHPTPNFMIQDADLIINVGSRFDDRITGRMSDFVPEARKAAELGIGGIIHVDIRRSEKAKQVEPTFFVHSTVKTFLTEMNAALKTRAPIMPRTAQWLRRKAELEHEFPIKIPTYATESMTGENGMTAIRTRISAQRVVRELDSQLLAAGKMDDAIFSTGVGIHQMVAAQLITWTQPRQMLSSGSLGTMGVALGYAIGAKLANGHKMVIAVDGDGSFNMTFTELKTVAEQKIPIKIMILDNESQMMVEYWQRLFHDARYLAVRNSQNPDYVKLAQAFGDTIRTVHCDREEDLEAAMNSFLFDEPDRPVLFHVRIERTPCLPLVAPGQPLDDMILEDVDVDVDQSAAPS